jgi:hypothetical protein
LKKISILCRTSFFILFFIGIFMFLCGDKESSKNWCSKTHTNYHICFHLFAYLAACYAFI